MFLRLLKHPKFYLLLSILIFMGGSIQMNRPYILMDDAFISFRYAVNLSHGQGLVFNPGERVEGYTNFLWTVILAACDRLGFNLITASKVLSALAGVGTLIVLYLIGKAVFASRSGNVLLISLPPLLFASMGSQARYVVSGMETLLFTFLILLAIYLLLFRKLPWIAGVIFALGAMTRPEGLLYFVLAGLFLMLERTRIWEHNPPPGTGFKPRLMQAGKPLILLGIGFLILYGPYFLWRYYYYGYLLPNTFYVKAAGFQWARLQRGWDILLSLLAEWWLAPILILSVFSLPSIRNNRVWLLFIAMLLATCCYFIYIGGDFIVWFGPRFLIPALPFLLLLCSEGLANVSGLRWLPIQNKTWFQLGISSILLIIAFWLSWPARPFGAKVFTLQMQGWAEMGHWIANHTNPDITIATDAAGLIPFYSERYTIDMFGLADTHIAHMDLSQRGLGVVAHEKYDPEYIMERKPDCIVSSWMDVDGMASAAGLPEVKTEFENLYELKAVAKVRNGLPADGRWVIPTTVYKPSLYRSGYIAGLYCLK
jgi:arabinofuranosyltransferase